MLLEWHTLWSPASMILVGKYKKKKQWKVGSKQEMSSKNQISLKAVVLNLKLQEILLHTMTKYCPFIQLGFIAILTEILHESQFPFHYYFKCQILYVIKICNNEKNIFPYLHEQPK